MIRRRATFSAPSRKKAVIRSMGPVITQIDMDETRIESVMNAEISRRKIGAYFLHKTTRHRQCLLAIYLTSNCANIAENFIRIIRAVHAPRQFIEEFEYRCPAPSDQKAITFECPPCIARSKFWRIFYGSFKIVRLYCWTTLTTENVDRTHHRGTVPCRVFPDAGPSRPPPRRYSIPVRVIPSRP